MAVNPSVPPSVPARAIILFAHGSRDPLWRKPIEAVASRIMQVSPGMLVRCAYLELTTPDLLTCASELAATHAKSISILPMFLGVGKHVREDMPGLIASLRQAHPTASFTLLPTVGEDERLIDLLAHMALSAA